MLLLLSLLACESSLRGYPNVEETDTAPVEADQDGVPEGLDCDDEDPGVRPAAQETCDGEDEDCETVVVSADASCVDLSTALGDPRHHPGRAAG